MIIKIRKFHAFSLAMMIAAVSFLFVLQDNRQAESVSSAPGLSLPVIMYHHVAENKNRAGKYVVMLSEIEQDLFYLKENGYTTVTVDDLIRYVNGEIQLPQKSVMITFDDGFRSVYELVSPILKKYEMKAVVFVVGAYSEQFTESKDTNVNYAYLDFDTLSEMDLSDEFEIQSHTYDLHHNEPGKRKGLAKLSNETDYEYQKAITDDLTSMQGLLKAHSNINATAIAYPFGAYSDSTKGIIKSLGFKSSFICEERINRIIPGEPETLFDLGRFNRPSGIQTRDFFQKVIH